MTPGQRIRRRRKELGLTQAALAKLAGCEQSTISELETGESKMPSAENLQGLAKALKVTKTWIITGKDGEIEVLTPEEEDLIVRIRAMSPEQRRAHYMFIRSLPGDDS